jgi:hypothetical protein
MCVMCVMCVMSSFLEPSMTVVKLGWELEGG